MKVLIISFFNQWITHLGTELELAQVHLDQGDKVEFLGCDGCIGACQLNFEGRKQVCDECRLRRCRGLQLLAVQPVEHRLGDYLPKDSAESEDQILGAITGAESARAFRFQGQDLGWGALATTVDVLRDPVCDSEKARELLKRFTRTAMRSYLAVKTFLQSHADFDRVYIFNGRFACARGAFRACQEHGKIEIMVHERGSSVEKYELFGGSMPHSREVWHERIDAAWSAAGNGRENTGRAFYEERRNGAPLDWKSYIGRQKEGLLPTDLQPSNKNIVIFNSSEDEFAGIGDEWRNPVYSMQSEGIQRVVSDAMTRYPDAHFYLRMHPHLAGVANKDVEKLHAIKSPNFTLIEPTSSISSYALLDVAERVLTFGSTVGIEATFWGKVSILAGHTFYEHLDAAHAAKDHNHVMELLGADLTPKPAVNALKYGFYLRTFGIPFRHWQADGFGDGTFRGTSLFWAPATHLECRILMRCLDRGWRSRFLQNVIHTFSKIAVYTKITACKYHIRRAIGRIKQAGR